jgi:hypothetical protein
MNIRHLQSRISEHVSTRFGLVGARTCPRGIFLTPFFQLKHDPNTYMILKLNMGGLGHSTALQAADSQFGTIYVHTLMYTEQV